MSLTRSYQRLIDFISGPEHSYSVEHRIFNAMSFSILFFVVIAAFLNFSLPLHWVIRMVNIVALAVCCITVVLTRKFKLYNKSLVFFFSIFCLICYSAVWFFNGGINGPIGYIYLMSIAIFVGASPAREYHILAGLVFMNLIALYALEYFNPQWITPYPDRATMYLDHTITILYSGFFILFSVIAYRITYQKEKEKNELQRIELEARNSELEEKNQTIETLAKELNHRVKNNLQIVSSLLSLQSKNIAEDTAQQKLKESKSRIDAMLLLHQRLYLTDIASATFINHYLSDLLDSLSHTYGIGLQSKLLKIYAEPIRLPIETATYIGFIVNELVTNAIKHAFDDENDLNSIEVRLTTDSRFLQLSVCDNGKGFTPQPKENSFGYELIQSLSDQLGATIHLVTDKGTQCFISIPLPS